MATTLALIEQARDIREALGCNVGFCDLPECPYRGLEAGRGAKTYRFMCWNPDNEETDACTSKDPLSCKYRRATSH